jgi:hypothetical protein
LFSNTFSLCSSLSVRDQVSHPYKITDELQHIKTSLQNNNYSPQTYLNTKVKRNKNTTSNAKQKQKWAKFTYVGQETRINTRLFKNTNIQTAYKTKKQNTQPTPTQRAKQTNITKVVYTE